MVCCARREAVAFTGCGRLRSALAQAHSLAAAAAVLLHRQGAAPCAARRGALKPEAARRPARLATVRISGPMPGGAAEGAGLFSSTLLCALGLGSAVRTFQINRGAAAGFLLQALVPLMDMAVLLPAPLGLSWDARSPEDAWASTVVGLPLLAFGFHWLNGDCSTANVLLGGALLLAGGSGSFSEEGKALVAQSVTAVASITILIVSIFTGNTCGILGGLLVGTAGLLAGSNLQRLLAVGKGDLLHSLMAAASLTLQQALHTQHRELDQGPAGLQVESSG